MTKRTHLHVTKVFPIEGLRMKRWYNLVKTERAIKTRTIRNTRISGINCETTFVLKINAADDFVPNDNKKQQLARE